MNMKNICEKDNCYGCMACVDICPKGAIQIKDTLSAYNAVIDEEKCVNCRLCHKICQNNNTLDFKYPIKWYQGWDNSEKIRSSASSGGAAYSLSLAFIKMGGAVCSCFFEDGIFKFTTAGTEEQLLNFSGSKYVKSNPNGIYKKIKQLLQMDNDVLFIGLPCQVAALLNYVGEGLSCKLYTIDIICHGTPSPQILNMFLKEYGYNLNEIENIRFRNKTKFQISCKESSSHKYNNLTPDGIMDRYTIAFLNSLIYTEKCYDCKYARNERISDITIGDSWGSNLDEDTQNRGVSLILIQTPKGMKLVENSDFHKEAVDLINAIKRNSQLNAPSTRPITRERFFNGIKNKKKANKLVLRCLPKKCIKQELLRLSQRVKVIRPRKKV